MFLLLDRIEHERRNRFAGKRKTSSGSRTFPASIRCVLFLRETRRTSDRPVETVVLHDFLHGKRIAHMISQDKTDNSIGYTREMRCSQRSFPREGAGARSRH